jgi:hypothetical protein
MDKECRRRYPVLSRLGTLTLFTLLTITSSKASANDDWWTAYHARVCTPDAQTCTDLYGQDLFNELQAAGLPYRLYVHCDSAGNPPWCTRSDAQKWTYVWTSLDQAGPYSVSNPAQGYSRIQNNQMPMLYFTCSEYTDDEYYKCTMGTGGQWGQWTITVWY